MSEEEEFIDVEEACVTILEMADKIAPKDRVKYVFAMLRFAGELTAALSTRDQALLYKCVADHNNEQLKQSPDMSVN